MRRLVVSIVSAVLLFTTMSASPGSTETMRRTAAPSAGAKPDAPQVLGVNYHPMWAEMTRSARADILDSLQDAGVEWVRIDVAWGTIQPRNRTTYDPWGVDQVDTRIREIRERGLKILLMFYWAPAWSSGSDRMNGRPGDPDDYARAAAWVAKRYDGSRPGLKVDAMELWNEPDLQAFWEASPAKTLMSDFTALVKRAGPAIKRANPAMTVVVGGPASVDTKWYRRFYRTPGIIGTYDAIGVHPYQSPGDAPPERREPGVRTFMTHLPELARLMDSVQDPARIWATEFGWSSHPNTADLAAWQRGVSRSEQAQYLLRGTALLASYPRVAAAFWYSARDTKVGDLHFDSYGLMESGGQPKPAFHAMRCAASGECGRFADDLPALRARVVGSAGRSVIVRARLQTRVPLALRGQRVRACHLGRNTCTAGRTDPRGVVRLRLSNDPGDIRIRHLGPAHILATPVVIGR